MTNARRPRALQVALVQAAIVIAIVVAWQFCANQRWINPFFYGEPLGVLQVGAKVIGNGSLLRNLAITLAETLVAFVVGMVVGSAAGLLLWWSPFWARVVDPFLALFNALPKIALAPMFVIWFGVGFGMKVALAFSLVSVIACMVAYDGTKQIDRDLRRMMETLGASKRQQFAKLVLPSCLPWIFSALRMCIGFALLGAVVGEFISSTEGLGFLIASGSSVYDLNLVWVALTTLLVLSALLQFVVGRLENRLLSHRRTH